MKRMGFVLSACLALFPGAALAQKSKVPPCYGEQNYATQSGLVALVNAKLINSFESIYKDNKPYHLKTSLLESKKTGKLETKDYPATDIYRQIQKFEVKTKENQYFEVLTISDVSNVECSMSGVTIILLVPEFKVLSTGAPTVSQ